MDHGRVNAILAANKARIAETREEQVARESDRALFKERAANEALEQRDAYWGRVEQMAGSIASGFDCSAWCREDASHIVEVAVDLVNAIDARRAREGGSK